MKTTIIFLGLLVFLISFMGSFVYAVPVENPTGLSYVSDTMVTDRGSGIVIKVNRTVYIRNWTIYASATYDRCAVWNWNGTAGIMPALVNITAIAGNVCNIEGTSGDVTLTAGNSYALMSEDKDGYIDGYTSTVSYPIQATHLNFSTATLFGYVYDPPYWVTDVNGRAGILSVWTEEIPGGTYPPIISDLNCTSCNIPNGSNISPYETEDTTPTFKFNTNESAWCRIANANLSYNIMNTSRNCTSGQGGTLDHICTLKDFDELKLTPTDYVYLTCINSLNNETNKTLEMQITQIQYNASQAIDKGIVISIPSATIYPNQQVYIRPLNNDQKLATFDKVAAYGSQRWAFNYIAANETSIGTFYNLSPVFYFLEMINLSTQAIINQVSSFINSTKT